MVKFSLSSPSWLKLFSIPIVFSSSLKVFLRWENKVNKHSYYSYKISLCPSLVPLGAFCSVNPGLCRKLWRHRERLADKVQTSRGQRGKRERLGTRLAASQCFSLWRADYTSRIGLACEQALCLGKKIARKGKGKGGREPVDKHLRPLFRPLVIILPNICQ